MAVFLNQVALFAELDESELARLERIISEHAFSPEGLIFREGDPSDSFYIIKTGNVKIVKDAPDGSQKVLATLNEGDFFGEMGVMKDSPRSAHAYALGATKLLKILKPAFLTLLDNNSLIAMKVRSAMVRRYSDNVFAFSKSSPGKD